MNKEALGSNGSTYPSSVYSTTSSIQLERGSFEIDGLDELISEGYKWCAFLYTLMASILISSKLTYRLQRPTCVDKASGVLLISVVLYITSIVRICLLLFFSYELF